MQARSIFFNDDDLLRSGWRFAVFVTAFLFAMACLGLLTVSFLSVMQVPLDQGSLLFMLVDRFVWLIPALFVGGICVKLLDNLPFRSLGTWFTKFWLKHLIFGLITGAVSIGFAVLIALVFGGLSFEINPAHGSTAILMTFGISFAIFAVAAAAEEALFRGYILQTFARSGYAWFAILLTSVFFGVLHAKNPSAGTISMLNTILAGIWFSVAYFKTRDLWFVWGMHFMWNWMQGAVFGIEVSGLTDITTAPLLKELDKGPAWFTGETYGVEGGIICTIAILLSTAAIYFLPILRPSEEMLALTGSNSDRLDLKRNIDSPRRMRETSDRDQIDA